MTSREMAVAWATIGIEVAVGAEAPQCRLAVLRGDGRQR
jgi:hypothetical protein